MLPSKDSSHFIHRCTKCGHKEAMYKKAYFVRAYNETVLIHSPNIFYICSNNKCCMYIHIEENIKIYTIDDVFMWYRVDFWQNTS